MDRPARIVAGKEQDMNQEDIIRVMRELIGPESNDWPVNEALLEEWLPFLQAIAAAGAAAEREACAQLCDPYIDSPSDHEAGTAGSIQDAIRARGNK